MRATLEIPRLSLAERDRRYAAVKKQMAARGLDAIVLWGWPLCWDFYTANARYLSPIGGNAEFNVLIFPAGGEPTSIIQMPTFVDGWGAAQNWVSDIRPRTKTWADSVANRIKELKLERGKIGMDGLAGPLDPDGWLPYDVYKQLTALLPAADIVSMDDMLEKIRSIKSDEELGVLRKAAAGRSHVGDLPGRCPAWREGV
jgi:Xaa-Pro aminopeptidase